MSYRFFLLALILSPALFSAECVPEILTENRDDIVYQLPQKTLFSGCVMQGYPNHHKRSELYYKDGRSTGEGMRWYENGQKESMVLYKKGKIASKRLWNQMGFLYTFEQYLDGKLLQPIEMNYDQAKRSCQDATFDGHSQWKLPSISELKRIPFSDTIREKTYIASDTPRNINGTKAVSYMRFGGSSEEGRWDMKGLDTNTPFNVLCVREEAPKRFRPILAVDGKADLSSTYATNDRPTKAAPIVATEAEVSTELSDETAEASASEPLPAAAAVATVAATATVASTTAEVVPAKDLGAAAVAPLKSWDKKKEVEKEVSISIKGVMHQEGLREGHYIVIYEFAGERPSQDSLNKIMLAGYRYTTITAMTDAVETSYVIIGPFSTTNKVAKELGRVHQRIESNAYIIANRH